LCNITLHEFSCGASVIGKAAEFFLAQIGNVDPIFATFSAMDKSLRAYSNLRLQIVSAKIIAACHTLTKI
jgi:hypothetical protein